MIIDYIRYIVIMIIDYIREGLKKKKKGVIFH